MVVLVGEGVVCGGSVDGQTGQVGRMISGQLSGSVASKDSGVVKVELIDSIVVDNVTSA